MEFKQRMSEEIFKQKYMINEETSVDQVFRNISQEIASAEKKTKLKTKYESLFYNEISSGRLIPAGRILANARPNTKMPYYNNCYTIGIQDKIDTIYESLKEDALISRTGGGVGINFSSLRPKGASLSKGGVSSGVISFMKVFNESAKIIQTGGSRRAAHIGVLNIDHPEIEDFILAKKGDENKELTQFNISVGISDKFMSAVNKDLDWDLQFEGKVYKTIKAKYLYDLIVKNAFTHNEPGILNLDTVNKYNNGYYEFEIKTTNPCFTGDMKLKTVQGYQTFKSLQNLPVSLITPQGEVKEGKVWSTGVKDIVEIQFYNKDISFIKSTPNHIFQLIDKSECMAQDLLKKQLMPDLSNPFLSQEPRFVQYGFIQGDGNLTRLNSKRHLGIEVNIGKNDQDVLKTFNIEDTTNKRTFYLTGFNEDLKSLKFDASTLPLRQFPQTYDTWSLHQKKSFLKGMFSANGGVIKGHRISYKATSKNLIKQLQQTLKEDLNISSYITTNKAKNIKFSNGTYLCKESYDLNISKYKDLILFYQQVNFIHKYKQNHLKLLLKFRSPKIKKILKLPQEEVFDFNISSEDHWGLVGGFVVHNCGEIPMQDYEMCCLSSIDFSKFVNKPFTSEASTDWEALAKTIKIGVRFLDNILDKTAYPLEKIKINAMNWRRIGLGFMGYGDTLAMLGLIYGSSSSKKYTKKLAQFFRDNIYEASISLAKEKGAFPKCDNKKISQAHFVKKLPEHLQSQIRKFGLRHISCMTTAPTGTTALTLGQNCSSGIEPIFSLQYDRNIRVDEGEETIKETIFDNAWLLYLDYLKQNNFEFSDAPKSFVTTFDIDVYDAIDIQAIWQENIDNSISKTLNLPNNITYEEYSKLFMYAYQKGLKGFTTFNPKGSLAGILEMSKTEELLKRTDEGVIIRPKDVPCDIHEIKYKGEDYLLLVGILENEAYEIFVTKNENKKEYPMHNKKKGTIRKIKKKYYNLIIENGEEKTYIEDIISKFDPLYLTLGKLISMGLRHHIPLQFIVQVLADDGNFMGFERTVSRILKKYIIEGEKVKTVNRNICPECGNSNLVYQEGCLTCSPMQGGCGWSKCS